LNPRCYENSQFLGRASIRQCVHFESPPTDRAGLQSREFIAGHQVSPHLFRAIATPRPGPFSGTAMTDCEFASLSKKESIRLPITIRESECRLKFPREEDRFRGGGPNRERRLENELIRRWTTLPSHSPSVDEKDAHCQTVPNCPTKVLHRDAITLCNLDLLEAGSRLQLYVERLGSSWRSNPARALPSLGFPVIRLALGICGVFVA